MITVKKYSSKDKNRWDDFIKRSKNGVFIFNRDYMEYHSDRFEDDSLLFFKNKKLVALMPANIKKDTLYSHEGLTFGGIISNQKMTMTLMLEVFRQLKVYLKGEGIKKVLYKSIPHIYHSLPSEEDLYALKANDAELTRRDVSSTIFMEEKIPYSRNKKRNLKNIKKTDLKIVESNRYEDFMFIEERRLALKYGAKPTHSAEEIKLLASRFPDNIKLFTVEASEEMYGGVIIFESENVAHAQYQAATDEGLKLGGTDLIFDYLINDYYKAKRYFNFGISTENEGQYLNEGLIGYKEQFGARAIVQDFYEWKF